MQQLILASKSPRRRELLTSMGYDFALGSIEVEETYDNNLKTSQITEYLSLKKANAYPLHMNEIVLTADTIVWFEGRAVEKPKDLAEAKEMLRQFSGKMHEVYSSIVLKSLEKCIVISDKSSVYFNDLTEHQIDYYVDTYQPLDKAGAYGIQEWIGLIGIKKIEGSFYTIMGLPTEKLYPHLVALIGEPQRK